MGLFDYLHCKYPLKESGANALEFQTKDTPSQYMEVYEISETGELFGEEYDTEDQSDKALGKGPDAFCGCMTRVNKRQKKCDMTGEVRFYTSWKPDFGVGSGWLEYSAYFVDGKLRETNLLQNDPPSDAA